MSEYTVDMEHPRKVRIYRNGDEYFIGKKIVVNERVYRNFEQFLADITKEVRLNTGAVRRLFDIKGRRIWKLEDMQDGQFYVASGGERFKKVNYWTQENGGIRSNRSLAFHRGETRGRRIVNDSNGGLLTDDEKAESITSEMMIFGPTSQGYKIAIFENGEFNAPYKKLVLNYRNCKTFDLLMKFLVSSILLKNGQVRKLYDAATGKRIRALQDIEPGQNIVVASYEPFKRGQYQIEDLKHVLPKTRRERTPGIVVTFFPNGDSYHSGFKVTLYRKRFPNVNKLIEHLNGQIDMVTGKIAKIYALDGARINQMEQFEKGRSYVVVSGDDPLIRTRYNVMAINYIKTQGLNGSTLRNEYMSSIRPITQRVVSKSSLIHPLSHAHDKYESEETKLKISMSRWASPVGRPLSYEPETSGVDTDTEDNKSNIVVTLEGRKHHSRGEKKSLVNKAKTPKKIIAAIEEEEVVKRTTRKNADEDFGNKKISTLESKEKAKITINIKPASKSIKPQTGFLEVDAAPKVKNAVKISEPELKSSNKPAIPSKFKVASTENQTDSDVNQQIPSNVSRANSKYTELETEESKSASRSLTLNQLGADDFAASNAKPKKSLMKQSSRPQTSPIENEINEENKAGLSPSRPQTSVDANERTFSPKDSKSKLKKSSSLKNDSKGKIDDEDQDTIQKITSRPQTEERMKSPGVNQAISSLKMSSAKQSRSEIKFDEEEYSMNDSEPTDEYIAKLSNHPPLPNDEDIVA